MKDLQNCFDRPSWVTGFVDGEGCFYVGFQRKERMHLKLNVRTSFSVTQKKHSLQALQSLQIFFKGGGLRYSRTDNTYKYETRNLSHILQYVLPHFEKVPLQTVKANDFALFRSICLSIHKGDHLNEKGLGSIVSRAYEMNQGGVFRKISKQDLLKNIPKLKV